VNPANTIGYDVDDVRERPNSGLARNDDQRPTQRPSEKEENLENHGLLYNVVAALLVIFPCWKIFQRVGMNPALSLFIFLPGLGWWIAGAILAFSKWPAIDAAPGGGTTNV
jgi:hypothetical protein